MTRKKSHSFNGVFTAKTTHTICFSKCFSFYQILVKYTEDNELHRTSGEKKNQLKLGYIEFAMTGVRHSAIVNPAGELLLTR